MSNKKIIYLAVTKSNTHHFKGTLPQKNQIQVHVFDYGRELLKEVLLTKEKIGFVIVDFDIQCCDALLTTIVIKNFIPELFVIGFCSNGNKKIINDFLSGGGDGVIYENIFLPTRCSIVNKHILENFSFLKEGEFQTEKNGFRRDIKTGKLSELTSSDVAFLILNSAGFSRKEIAHLLCKSEASVKKYISKMCTYFGVKYREDLLSVSISYGVVKLLMK